MHQKSHKKKVDPSRIAQNPRKRKWLKDHNNVWALHQHDAIKKVAITTIRKNQQNGSTTTYFFEQYITRQTKYEVFTIQPPLINTDKLNVISLIRDKKTGSANKRYKPN